MSEQETHAEIIAEMRKTKYGDEECNVKWCLTPWADRLDAAHKREVDALEQRRAELNAEIAAKDEVIKRLNDAISEEQRRQMATTENPSAVGNVAKLREAVTQMLLILYDAGNKFSYPVACGMCKAYARKALSAPPRNCDKYANHNDAMKAFDAFVRAQGKLGFINPYTEAFKWLFAPATEKEGGSDAD